MRTAVKGYVIKDGKVLLLKRIAGDMYSGIWEPAGGKISPGETLEDGLRREIKEETGLDVQIVAPLCVHHFTDRKGEKVHMITFVCLWKAGDVRLSEEHSEFRWIPLKNLPDWIHSAYSRDVNPLLKLSDQM